MDNITGRTPASDQGELEVRGYMVGVASGAIAFWLIAALCVFMLRPEPAPWGSTGLTYPRPNPVVVILVCAIFLALWVLFAWVITLPLFLLVRRVARKFNFRSLLYYLCGGLISSALLDGLHELVGWHFRAGEPASLAEHMIGVISYGYGGALGAFIFWWIAVKPREQSTR